MPSTDIRQRERHLATVTSRTPFFSVGAGGTRFYGHDHDAAEEFATRRAILCHCAIEPPLLARLMAICDRADWLSDPVQDLGHRRIESPAIAGRALTLALKRPDLFDWLESVTRCGPLREVSGRIVQTEPAPDDQLTWHDDRDGSRRLAITINLSDRPYEGGLFELRDTTTCQMLFEHHHIAPGQALIFEVTRRSEHRVLPILSGGPRRVYAGWFMAHKTPPKVVALKAPSENGLSD